MLTICLLILPTSYRDELYTVSFDIELGGTYGRFQSLNSTLLSPQISILNLDQAAGF